MASFCQHCVPALLVALFCLLSRSADAAKFSVKNATIYTGNIQLHKPPSQYNSTGCTEPFFCKPQLVTVKGNSLWAFCGFHTSHKMQLLITSNTSKANFTSQVMRKKALVNCGLKNLTNLASCEQLDFSICDTLAVCDLRILGMAYNDESCLIIANNKNTSMNVFVQVNSWYSRSRTYGAAFAVVTGILFFGGMFTYLGWRFRQEWYLSTYHLSYTGGHFQATPILQQPLIEKPFYDEAYNADGSPKTWKSTFLNHVPWIPRKISVTPAHVA